MQKDFWNLHPALKGGPSLAALALVKAGEYLSLSEIAAASVLDQDAARTALRILERAGLVIHMADADRWSVIPDLISAYQQLLNLHGPDTEIGRKIRGAS